MATVPSAGTQVAGCGEIDLDLEPLSAIHRGEIDLDLVWLSADTSARDG